MLALSICLGVFAGLLFLLFLVSFIIHHRVFKNRYEPDGITKYYTLEDFPNLKGEDVAIPTKRGILRGLLYSYPELPSRGILVFSHGMWGSHSAYVQDIEFIARQGFSVLGFDYYGTERSDGKNIKGLGNSLYSLNEAIKYVKKRFPKEPIYVMGHSWGGYAALGIAKYHKDIKGIVAMAPFISLTQILSHMLPKGLRICIPFLLFIDTLHCGRYSLVQATKILKKTNIPILILHSKDDGMIPFSKSTEVLMKKVLKENVKYYIVDQKGHNPEYADEAVAYMKASFQKLNFMAAEEKTDYRKTLDYHKMGKLDLQVMERITDFLKN